MSEPKVHLVDPWTWKVACGTEPASPAHSTSRLEKATCKVCIKIITVGHR